MPKLHLIPFEPKAFGSLSSRRRKIEFRTALNIGIVAGIMFSYQTATASILMSVERINDQQAVITASGTLDDGAPLNSHMLFLEGIVTILPAFRQDNVFLSSTMRLASAPIQGADTVPADWGGFEGTGKAGIDVYSLTSGFEAYASISGALKLQLPSADVFASVGTTGLVYWGNQGLVVGSYQVVTSNRDYFPLNELPEPSSVALLALGAAGIFAGRKRKAPFSPYFPSSANTGGGSSRFLGLADL